MGQSLVINQHISTKWAPHRPAKPPHKGKGGPQCQDQWLVSCFSTIWHAEGFLRYSCAKKSVRNFFSNDFQNLKVTEFVARCSVLSTSSSSFSPRSMITSMLATMMSFTWSISDWTLSGKKIFSVPFHNIRNASLPPIINNDSSLRSDLIRVPHCSRIGAFLAESLDFTEEEIRF